MEAIRRVLEPITAVFEAGRRASSIDYFEPLSGTFLDENLARCARSVGPCFLPALYCGGDLFGLHVQPGMPLSDAPIVYWSHDLQGLRVFGRGLGQLPICLYLNLHASFRSNGRLDPFLAFLDAAVQGLPGGVPLPEALFHEAVASNLDSSWEPMAKPDADPYHHARHPFAGMPAPTARKGPPALAAVDAFIATLPDADAHVRGLRAAVALRAFLPLEREHAVGFLPYECHYYPVGSDCPGFTTGLRGLVHWDKVVSDEGAAAWLMDTPLEPLATCPNAFSCEDPAGVPALLAVANNYRSLGDRERELGTLRNAATVAIVMTRRCPRGLLERIAEVCDAIEPGGLATGLTLAYAEARKASP